MSPPGNVLPQGTCLLRWCLEPALIVPVYNRRCGVAENESQFQSALSVFAAFYGSS
jgi:hypothetical protein